MNKDRQSKWKTEIRNLLQNINDAWTSGSPEDLESFFHEDMIIAKPGGPILGKGKQKCVNSYKDFLKRGKVLEFEASEPEIEVWENTAVASYSFEIEYELEGKEFREKGVDLFVFNQREGKWLAVWRAVLSSP